MAPLDALWFMEGHEYGAWDLDMECRRWATPIKPAFVGWHNLEVFALPHAMRHKHYMCVPDWYMPLEPPRVLLVSSPVVFAYYSGASLRGLAHFRFVW